MAESESAPEPTSESTPGSAAAEAARRYKLPLLAAFGTVGAMAAAELARSRYQKSRMFAPERYPEGDWDPSAHGLVAEDRWFDSPDGVKLHGWWIPRDGARTTLLFCHGNTGSIGHRLDVLRFMSELGANIFAFDYRGFGRSEGEPDPEGLCLDARAAFEQVIGPLGQPAESVVLVGHSLGGAVAVRTAAEQRVAGLVVQSTFTDMRAMARVFHPRLPLHLVTRNYYRSVELVPRLAMPKLFVHGTADETIPIHLGRELFREAASPKLFYAVHGAGHTDVHERGGQAYLRVLTRFLGRCGG